jgi:hypothetical protein
MVLNGILVMKAEIRLVVMMEILIEVLGQMLKAFERSHFVLRMNIFEELKRNFTLRCFHALYFLFIGHSL